MTQQLHNYPDFRRAPRALALALTLSTTLAACSPGFHSPSTAPLANRATDVVGCTSFEDDFWDELYKYPLEGRPFPAADEMQKAFEDSILTGRLSQLSAGDQNRIRDSLTELYRLLALDTVTQLADDSTKEGSIIEALAAMEMGDRTTPEKDELQTKIRTQLDEINQLMATTEAPGCSTLPNPTPVDEGGALPVEPTATPESASGSSPVATPQATATTLFSSWKASRHPAVYGALKALATSYQSCEAGQVRAMIASDPKVSGISIVGTHSNGVGSMREITDLASMIRTHYYLSSYRKPSTGSNCHAVLQKPMIYDYGGKPYAGSGDTSTLDFFRNAGSGTSDLGIDCSGYIYSSLATAGLKLKASGKLKAIGVSGVNSAMYKSPQSNGLTCLDYASFSKTQNLQPGDILASSGHVIMIETIGSDPFGISKLTSESQCTKSGISISRFDFTILQSSPIKGGMGIDRIRGADYLADGGTMATAMMEHAINACLAKFRGTTTTKSANASLVRHKGTAECKDTAIKLEHEECVSSCPVSPSTSSLLL